MMSSREHTEGFATLIYIGRARKKKAPYIKMTTAALLGLAARQMRICPTTHNHHRHTNKPTKVYVTQTNTAVNQRKTPPLFSFSLMKKEEKKMQRCVECCMASY